MLKRTLHLLVASLSVIVLTSVSQPMQPLHSLARDSNSCRTFKETGKTVCGRFLAFWQSYGTLPIFGYPISNSFEEKSELDAKKYTIQYFERAVFELHPENKPPYDVMLARLGAFRFDSRYSGFDPGEPNEKDLPLYPKAQNVKVVIIDLAVPDQDEINKTTFETLDSASAVIAFYKEVLEKSGWGFDRQIGPSYIRYVYVAGSDNPAYGLSVEVTATTGKTHVILRLDKTLPK